MRKPPALLWRVVAAAPDLVPAALAGFSVGPMFLLVIGQFYAAVAVPVGLLGAALACWLVGLSTEPSNGPGRWPTLAALAVAAVWTLYNLAYTAQDVYSTRDPATYTLAGRWLVDHHTLRIDTMLALFGNPPDPHIGSTSYSVVAPGILNAQGDHLLPVLLGLSGKLFGTTALLKTNVVITALALLSFYGLARRLVGGWFAVVIMSALAVSMPVIYVARDTFTEPLLMLFLMSALLFVQRGWTSRRWQDWAVAGLVSGAAVCVRVDSYAALLGIVAGITLFAGVAATVPDRRHAVRCAVALAAGAVAPITLGWIDLTRLSQQYFGSQHANITHLVYLLIASALASPVVVWLLWRTRLRAALASPGAARWLPRVAAGLLAAAFIAFATRPAWQTTHGPFVADLENMQRRWHAPVDGTRTYNEQNLRWQALYYGWITVALAFVGYGVLFTQLVRRRAYALAAVLGMGIPMSLLYLVNSEVSPDQPWAMRRYVPVIIPLFLVAAAAALRAAWQWGSARKVVVRPLVVAALLVMVSFPMAISWPMRHVREERGQLAQLTAICRAIGKHAAVITTDHETVVGYNQSLRSFCNVPVVGLLGYKPQQLAAVGATLRAHGKVPFVLGQTPDVTGGQAGHAFSVVDVQRWPTQINKAPDQPDAQEYAMWLSEIDTSGRLVPVPPLTRAK